MDGDRGFKQVHSWLLKVSGVFMMNCRRWFVNSLVVTKVELNASPFERRKGIVKLSEPAFENKAKCAVNLHFQLAMLAVVPPMQ